MYLHTISMVNIRVSSQTTMINALAIKTRESKKQSLDVNSSNLK